MTWDEWGRGGGTKIAEIAKIGQLPKFAAPTGGLGIEKNRLDFCRDVLAIVTSRSSTILTRSWVELGTERESLLQVLNENAYFRR